MFNIFVPFYYCLLINMCCLYYYDLFFFISCFVILLSNFKIKIMWNCLFQETLRQTSRRSGTKNNARSLTQHTLPACWTQVPSAWRQGCAWTAAVRASALCPVTSATWALGLHVLQSLCCSTSRKPRQSTIWSTATTPTRYL